MALPVPLVFEDFESVAEGGLPAGWTAVNFTETNTPGADLNDPHSDSYLGWTVISRQRVIALGAAGAWDAYRRLLVAPGQMVNGMEITNLAQGKFVYAESDVRWGSQVQYLFSPDFNLLGKSNIFLCFYSVYEQNQNSFAAVEYSVDGGREWLPIVYFIDRNDLIRGADGSIDAATTLSEPRSDTANFVDPITGATGGYYGAFIGVPRHAWGTLAPFISGRIDDDPVQSKRVEIFRLSRADNQSRVRFRFAHAGYGSWYFGLDNFGLYRIPSDIRQDLAVHLPFDTDFNDLSGNGVHGIPVGSPALAPGRIGSGALVINSRKDGTSFNYVTLGTNDIVRFGTNTDFSISFWVNCSRWEGDPAFVANKDWNSGVNIGFVIATASDAHLQWNYRVTGGATRKDYDGPPGTLNDSNWHHVVVTFQRQGNAVTYLDGLPVKVTPLGPASGTIDSGLPLNIGQDGTGRYTDLGTVGFEDGQLDDLAIWRRVLAGSEVEIIFNRGTTGQSFGHGAADLRITAITSDAGKVTLAWSGGIPPFAVQRKRTLTDSQWVNVLTTANRVATLPPESTHGFYRISGQAPPPNESARAITR